MLSKAKRLYVLIPVLGLIAVSQTASAIGANGSKLACPVVLTQGAMPGESNNFLLSDVTRAPLDGSKIRYNFKLVTESIFQKIEGHYGPLEFKGQKSIGFDWDAVKKGWRTKVGQITDRAGQYYAINDLFATYFKDAHYSAQWENDGEIATSLQYRRIGDQYGVRYADAQYPKDQRIPEAGDQLISINGVAPDQMIWKYPSWTAKGNLESSRTLFGLSLGRWSESGGVPIAHISDTSQTVVLKSAKTGEQYTVVLPMRRSGTDLNGNDLATGKPSSGTPFQPLSVISHTRQYAELAKHHPHTAMKFEHLSHQFAKFDNLFKAKATFPDAKPKAKADGVLGTPVNLGDTNPEFPLPKDFKQLDFADEIKQDPTLSSLIDTKFFLAGTFVQDGKNVGYLRIPSFEPQNLSSMLPALRYYIGHLQASTDYLVVDQTSNPGGYVIMSDLVVKSLTGSYDTTKHLRYAVKPTMDFLAQFKNMANEVLANSDGLLTPAQQLDLTTKLNTEYAKIDRAWRTRSTTGIDPATGKMQIDPLTNKLQERDSLSEPVSMIAMSEYAQIGIDATLKQLLATQVQGQNGQPVTMGAILKQALGVDITEEQVYTKPVYYVINELCASGGDATPATLQDYGRVTIVGLGSSHTMGAGATVGSYPISQTGDIEGTINMSQSLMARANFSKVDATTKMPVFDRTIENYGVRATLVVPLQFSDLADGGVNVQARLRAAISQDFQKNHANTTTAAVVAGKPRK